MRHNKQLAIVIIGDEILEGTTVDCNSATLIAWATEQGHRVRSVQVVGDDHEIIKTALRRARHDGAELIITTGGVGPTLDDITIEAVGRSQGMNEDHELPEMLAALRSWIGAEPQGVRRRTATAPIGTTLAFPEPHEGRTGWPAFVVGDTICLPGIPRLLERLLSVLPRGGGRRPSAALRFEGYETEAAEALEAVNAQYPELSFGSYPPTARGDRWVRLTARGSDPKQVEAAMHQLVEVLRQAGLEPERLP